MGVMLLPDGLEGEEEGWKASDGVMLRGNKEGRGRPSAHRPKMNRSRLDPCVPGHTDGGILSFF